MNTRERQQQQTKREILAALADLVAEHGPMGVSVQDVADRARVTHRTVYNHFPTRDALNDGLAVFVEEELAERGTAAPDLALVVSDPETLFEHFFAALDEIAPHVRAYVMVMVASRTQAKVGRDRIAEMQKVFEREVGPFPRGTGKLVTAAVRLFVSSTGWHLLTEHFGLSTREAARAAGWATRVLLKAAANGDLPRATKSRGEKRDE